MRRANTIQDNSSFHLTDPSDHLDSIREEGIPWNPMIWMVFMISESLDSFAFIHHLQGIRVCSWTEVPFLIKLKPCGTSCVGVATLSYTGSVYLLPTLMYWLSGPQVGIYHPSVFTIDGDRAEWSSFPSKVSLPVCKKILNRSDHYGAIHIFCSMWDIVSNLHICLHLLSINKFH